MFILIVMLTNTPQDNGIIQRAVMHMSSDITGCIYMRKLLTLLSDNENK